MSEGEYRSASSEDQNEPVKACHMSLCGGRPRGGFFVCILALLGSLVTAQAATLLPNGKQQFFNANGAPLAGGSVAFYVPGTTTPKITWQDSAQTIANTPVVSLDISGSAVIYGSGCYRQIVKDASGNTIWDQPTCDTSSTSLIWAGHSGGTANSQTLTASNFSSVDGQTISFIAGQTNTGPLGLVVNGSSPINVLRDTASGPFSLSGGEVFTGNNVQVQYDATRGAFHLISNPVTGSNPLSTLSASGTTDLGSAASRYVNITGTATISSLGSSASQSFPLYTLTFGGASVLTNSASLVLPGGANITTAAGDYALAAYQGSGNWKVLHYAKVTGGTIVPAPIEVQILSCPWTVPTNGGTLPIRVDWEVVGAGGGGGGNGNAIAGGVGGATTFGGTTANGGGAGVHSANSFGTDGGLGGTSGAGGAAIRLAGQAGFGSGSNEGGAGTGTAGVVAGSGGRAAFSMSYGGAWSPSNLTNRMNGGLGGGGAGYTSGSFAVGSSSGGGGGEYARGALIGPGTTVTCTLGAGGAAGTAAGAGGAGAIMTRSYWQ